MIKINKFGQIEIALKEFNSVYQITTWMRDKNRVSKGVIANKHGTIRYLISSAWQNRASLNQDSQDIYLFKC